jgi:hypothetical protein
MNTLNRTITSTFFKSEEDYNKLMAHWSQLMQNNEARKCLRAEHHILYLVLRGKDWRKGFTLATNPIKLANGMAPDLGVKNALYAFHCGYITDLLAPFGDLVDKEMLEKARALVPKGSNPLEKDAYDNIPVTA